MKPFRGRCEGGPHAGQFLLHTTPKYAVGVQPPLIVRFRPNMEPQKMPSAVIGYYRHVADEAWIWQGIRVPDGWFDAAEEQLLDRFAETWGTRREPGESDPALRSRLLNIVRGK